jgi:hypothetical protein
MLRVTSTLSLAIRRGFPLPAPPKETRNLERKREKPRSPSAPSLLRSHALPLIPHPPSSSPADPASPARASLSSRRQCTGSWSCYTAPTCSQLHDLLSISLRWWWTSRRIRTRRSGYGTVKHLTPEHSTHRCGGRCHPSPR